jgi:hypothetical protein
MAMAMDRQISTFSTTDFERQTSTMSAVAYKSDFERQTSTLSTVDAGGWCRQVTEEQCFHSYNMDASPGKTPLPEVNCGDFRGKTPLPEVNFGDFGSKEDMYFAEPRKEEQQPENTDPEPFPSMPQAQAQQPNETKAAPNGCDGFQFVSQQDMMVNVNGQMLIPVVMPMSMMGSMMMNPMMQQQQQWGWTNGPGDVVDATADNGVHKPPRRKSKSQSLITLARQEQQAQAAQQIVLARQQLMAQQQLLMQQLPHPQPQPPQEHHQQSVEQLQAPSRAKARSRAESPQSDGKAASSQGEESEVQQVVHIQKKTVAASKPVVEKKSKDPSRFCPFCAGEVKRHYKFCQFCGKSVAAIWEL